MPFEPEATELPEYKSAQSKTEPTATYFSRNAERRLSEVIIDYGEFRATYQKQSEEPLGEGGSGIVYLFSLKNDTSQKIYKNIAIKQYKFQVKEEDVRAEATKNKKIRGLGIYYDTPHKGVVMAYVKGDTMSNIKPENVSDFFKIISAVFYAYLQFYTQFQMQHRDAGGDNVIITKDEKNDFTAQLIDLTNYTGVSDDISALCVYGYNLSKKLFSTEREKEIKLIFSSAMKLGYTEREAPLNYVTQELNALQEKYWMQDFSLSDIACLPLKNIRDFPKEYRIHLLDKIVKRHGVDRFKPSEWNDVLNLFTENDKNNNHLLKMIIKYVIENTPNTKLVLSASKDTLLPFPKTKKLDELNSSVNEQKFEKKTVFQTCAY